MKTSLTLLLLLLAMAVAPLPAQEIYRVVDADGNVTYTDQKPTEDAEPLKLPELNVLEEDAEVLPIDQPAESKSLEFRIVSPQDGELVVGRPGGLPVQMDINLEVPPAAQIVIYLNGIPQEPVRSLDVTLDQMPEGDYQMRAELQTPGGRVLATTEPVNFTVAGLIDFPPQ